MVIEHVSGDGGDPTAAAIKHVLVTLYDERDLADHDAAPGSTGVVDDQKFPDDHPPQTYDGNHQLEKEMMAAGIFKTRGDLQRRVLGCLGCRLDGIDGDWRGIRPQTIADCSGGSLGGVKRIMSQLRNEGLLESQRHSGDGRGPQPVWFTTTPEWEAFDRRPQAPPACGADGQQEQPNAAGEQLLLDEGAIGWRGPLSKAALGCIACQLSKGEDGVYAKLVADCQGVLPNGMSTALRGLMEAGALEAEQQSSEGRGGWPRVIYKPASTPLGQALAAVLEVPRGCGLEAKRPGKKGPAAA